MDEEPIISAEIEAAPDRAQQAAKALQGLGFRILRIDPLISMDAPKSLWEAVFGVSFEHSREPQFSEFEGGEREIYTPVEDTLEIPADLGDLIQDIIFAVPPDLYDEEPPEMQP